MQAWTAQLLRVLRSRSRDTPEIADCPRAGNSPRAAPLVRPWRENPRLLLHERRAEAVASSPPRGVRAPTPDLFSPSANKLKRASASLQRAPLHLAERRRAACRGPSFRCAKRRHDRRLARRAVRGPGGRRRFHAPAAAPPPVRWHLISPQLAVVVVRPAAAQMNASPRADVDAARAPDALRGRERRRRRPRRAALSAVEQLRRPQSVRRHAARL